MARTRTSSDVELLLPLDRESPQPLHRQLEQGLREAIRDGRLPAATGLPSSRAFATQLGVSRGIVVEAYEQLVAEGYLASRPGGATRVARSAIAAPFHQPEARARPGRVRLPARPARRVRVPARGLAPQPARGPAACPERSADLPRRPRDPGAPGGPRHVPQPGPRHGRRPGGRRHLQRLRAGPRAHRAGDAGARRARGRGRGPVRPRVPGDARGGRPRHRGGPRRRARPARRPAGAARRRRRRRHRRPPVPDGRRAAARSPGGPRGLGGAGRAR